MLLSAFGEGLRELLLMVEGKEGVGMSHGKRERQNKREGGDSRLF